MNQSKISTNKISQYFREISVVVIGVAITLSVGNWISNNNEKRDIVLYLTAIKLELEDNIQLLEDEANYLEDWENYALYLRSHDKKSLHADSIRGLDYPGLGSVSNFIFHTSAFEMFKASGAMRLINDKEMLQSLWRMYLRLEIAKIQLDKYYQLKMEEGDKISQLILEGTPIPIPLYDFFYKYAGFGALEGCKYRLKELKETVEKIENTLNIKQRN